MQSPWSSHNRPNQNQYWGFSSPHPLLMVSESSQQLSPQETQYSVTSCEHTSPLLDWAPWVMPMSNSFLNPLSAWHTAFIILILKRYLWITKNKSQWKLSSSEDQKASHVRPTPTPRPASHPPNACTFLIEFPVPQQSVFSWFPLP